MANKNIEATRATIKRPNVQALTSQSQKGLGQVTKSSIGNQQS